MRLIPALLLLLLGVGCIDRARVNARCEWSPEVAAVRNLGDRQMEQHLDSDVELATELAVRYADAVHKQRVGYEGHGGLIEGGDLRDRCMATLLSAIAMTHDVSLGRVVAARTRSRRPMAWDATVIVLFAVLYVGISWLIAGFLSRRFPADEGWPALAAPAIASLCISAGGLQLFDLWAVTLEMVRVGNDHLSGYRASWSPWDDHLIALYVAGIFIFLVTAGLHHRFDTRRFEIPGQAV